MDRWTDHAHFKKMSICPDKESAMIVKWMAMEIKAHIHQLSHLSIHSSFCVGLMRWVFTMQLMTLVCILLSFSFSCCCCLYSVLKPTPSPYRSLALYINNKGKYKYIYERNIPFNNCTVHWCNNNILSTKNMVEEKSRGLRDKALSLENALSEAFL